MAHSTGWRLLGFDKGQWEAIHSLIGYVGALFAVFHLVLNWKALRNYLRDRAQHDIPVADGLAHLAAYGLKASPTTRVRTLSDGSIYAPSDVANIILGLEPGEHEEND